MPVPGRMSPGVEVARFSPTGDFLAVCSPDGRLSVWSGREGGPARLEQQLVPSHHLEASTTCLAWGPGNTTKVHSSPGKRKKKASLPTEEIGGDLVALGTRAGRVLIYSIKQGQMITSLKKDGGGSVNCLTWTNSGSSIYTGGEEGNISIYSVSKMSFLDSFQAGNDTIFRLALSSDDSTLFCGSRDIKIWSIASRSLLKTLTGHCNPVSGLIVSSGFLFSTADDERTVTVWRIEGEERSSVASLAVNEAVKQFDLNQEDRETTVSVVTMSGLMQLFLLRPEKKYKKALKPVKSLTIATDKDEKGRISQVPVLAAKLSQKGDLMIGHGESIRPSVERIDISQMETNHCLVRNPQIQSNNQDQFTKTVTPKTDGGVTFLAPGVSMPVGTGKLGKRKPAKEPGGEESLPMEDRLALLSTVDGSKTPPRTDTMAQLLAQGLHSNDNRILSSVLDRADPDLIDNTVKRIPVEAVLPLVTNLMKFIKGRGRVDASHAKWLRSVLSLHTGYLVSVPECRDLLTPVYALLEARTSHYPQVLQLRGKLELLTKQTDVTGEDTEVDTGKEALLVYQDDSSDELEDVMDDLLVPASDTDDDWENDEMDETMDASKLVSDSDDCVEIVNGDGGQDDEDMDSEEED